MRNAEKTKCPNNHPYSGENLMWVAGRRVCRECNRASSRRAYRPKSQLGGGHVRGSAHGRAQLTEAKVREIRRDYEPRVVSHAKLAARYEVGLGTIQNVLNGTTWRHLLDD